MTNTFAARVATLLLCLAVPTVAQAQTGFVSRTIKDAEGEHQYRMFVPPGYTPDRAWPVLLYLHGAGERGTDGELPTTSGPGPYLKVHPEKVEFLVVFPQAEDTQGRRLTGWLPETADAKRALAILDQVSKDYRTDPKRIVLSGWSMGAYGTWALAAAHPEKFSAIVPVAGGGDPEWAPRLKSLPVWAIHGAADAAVKPEESRRMIDAIKAAGGTPRYTEIPDGTHDIWDEVYSDPALYAWMRAPQAAASSAPLLARPRARTLPSATANTTVPFVAAAEIPHAVSVRLGNEMLKALADSIPVITPPELLAGTLPNQASGTQVRGIDFSVQLYGIGYRAHLNRVAVEAWGRDLLRIQMGLSNITVFISGASVAGEGNRSAQAGPMSIVIAQTQPAWLIFDVAPTVIDGQLKLRLVNSSFRMPPGDYAVSQPAGISVRGWGMTRERVSNGLVSGLYEQRSRIEQQISSVVPGLIAQIESRLKLDQANTALAGFWPLPVYSPRLRVRPSSVSTDADGVTIVMDVQMAAIDPSRPPAAVKVFAPASTGADVLAGDRHFAIGVAPGLLEPLSEMLIKADVARVHVLDTPIKPLHRLADAAQVAEILPEIKRFGDKVELWSELVLAAPVRLTEAHGSGLTFEVPRLVLSLAVKTPESGEKWQPFAEFEMHVKQQARTKVNEQTWDTRGLALTWEGKPDLQVASRFAPQYTPEDTTIDQDKLETLLKEAWADFTAAGVADRTNLPDLDLGYARLRAKEALGTDNFLGVRYSLPVTRVGNDSAKPLVYSTKGPYSDWGAPLTLAPGKHHDFPLATPMLIRFTRDDGQPRMYTLRPGTFSEYTIPRSGGVADLVGR